MQCSIALQMLVRVCKIQYRLDHEREQRSRCPLAPPFWSSSSAFWTLLVLTSFGLRTSSLFFVACFRVVVINLHPAIRVMSRRGRFSEKKWPSTKVFALCEN